MGANAINRQHVPINESGQQVQPIWVFESKLDGDHDDGASRIAAKCLGAVAGQASGAMGFSYAIPTRDQDNKLLPWSQIEPHTKQFIEHATANPELQFKIIPSRHPKSEDEFKRFADLLRKVPSNCELPGRTLELLGRSNSIRVVTLDANVRAEETMRSRALDQYFAVNAALWNCDNIEIVSFGSAQTLVYNDRYAKSRGYVHRLPNVVSETFDKYIGQARETLAIAYANRLVILNDPMGTSTGNQLGALNAGLGAGLVVDEILMQ